ncbi:unnamed protein product [Angiostrongylus costaricensis]|uniref:Calponin-homology (CH) domain-containing protein n=1 Tax=Angiostrongylus costaricensis TaxID=334426 RepID=A0A0R3PW72_ANGCS|nr:unnamed protein product [Angiostrongylus costaricensis]
MTGRFELPRAHQGAYVEQCRSPRSQYPTCGYKESMIHLSKNASFDITSGSASLSRNALLDSLRVLSALAEIPCLAALRVLPTLHCDRNRLRLRNRNQYEEVTPAIRLDDAEWKIIQQNTFTRWVNNHLKRAGDSIENLETDLSDGLKLISLAAVLSQKNVGRFNKKVNFRSQKLENVSLALKFFQDVEHIKIVNIDSSHIVDQNKKLILGLIWTLILHYSISMGWIQERHDGQVEETPKQKLLNWIRSKLPPGMPVTNFTSDWNDGIALGALVFFFLSFCT